MAMIDEIAIHIGIVFVDAPVPGEAIRVQRMQHHELGARRHASRQCLRAAARSARPSRNSLPPHGCPRSAAAPFLASRGPMVAVSRKSGRPSRPLADGMHARRHAQAGRFGGGDEGGAAARDNRPENMFGRFGHRVQGRGSRRQPAYYRSALREGARIGKQRFSARLTALRDKPIPDQTQARANNAGCRALPIDARRTPFRQ